MLPYSIGHEIILTSQDNPLVTIPEEEFNELPISRQISSIIRAAIVCSRTYDDTRPQRRFKLWLWALRNTDWPAEIAEFRIYRSEGSVSPTLTDPRFSEIPVTSDDATPSRALGSPLMARLVNFLASRPSISANIHDYPLGAALFEYFASLEENGRVQVENVTEAETRAEFDQKREEILREYSKNASNSTPCH